MRMGFRKARPWVALLGLLCLVLSLAAPAPADDWTTRGGDKWRRNVVTGSMGRLGLSDWTQLGQSATQPIVVGNFIYHLAGLGLYQLQWSADTQTYEAQLIAITNSSPTEVGVFRASHSTPTYSPRSGRIYFGDAFGRLWAVDPNATDLTKRATSYAVALGCQIVSSPLVLRDAGDTRDLVIVGTKPVGPKCGDSSGRSVMVWGLDGVGSLGANDTDYTLGGWATPSPIPGPSNETDTAHFNPQEFIAGADGTNGICAHGNGIVRKFGIVSTGDATNPSYSLMYEKWGQDDGCWPNGVADGFSALNWNVYWVDKYGFLYKKNMLNGQLGADFPVDLQQKLGGLIFTNTVPAPVQLSTGRTLVYVTLRNFAATGDHGIQTNAQVQAACPPAGSSPCTGAPGAIVAVNDSGGIEWTQHLPWGTTLNGLPAATWESANTNPLVLQDMDRVLFADVWGNLNSYHVAAQASGQQQADLTPTAGTVVNLLQAGQSPFVASDSYSQESGAGTDPVLYRLPDGTGSLLVGVNYQCAGANYKCGEIYIAHLGATYNLRWDKPPTAAPTGNFSPGQTVSLSGTVRLDDTTRTLAQLRRQPAFEVHWYVAPKGWLANQLGSQGAQGTQAAPQLVATSPLPPDLQGGGPSAPVGASFTWSTAYPDDGEILGVIDPVGIARTGTPDPQATARLLPDVAATLPPFTPPENVEEAKLPSGTDGYADNFASAAYQNLDLAVSLTVPDQWTWSPPDGPDHFVATWTARNTSGAAMTTPVMLYWFARDDDGHFTTTGHVMLTLGAQESRTGTFNVPPICNPNGGSSTELVQVEINPEPHVVAETRYDNNMVLNKVQVTCDVPTGPTYPTGTSGPGTVIIVPNDCIANPDPTSDQPCTNYPGLRIPGWH